MAPKARPARSVRSAKVTALPAGTYTIPEAAQRLGIGTSTAYRLAAGGDDLAPGVPVRKIGRGSYRVLRADLDRYLDGEVAG